MSNYLSRPYQASNPVSWTNEMMYASKAADELQNTYDANRASRDQLLAKFEQLRGERDVDNDYIAAKIKEVDNHFNQFGNRSFLHKSTTTAFTSSLMNIIQDPIVRDAILSRQVKQNFDAEAAKRKEKNDGSYNDVNYQYSKEQGGYYDYMAGKTNKLSNLSYIPYVDLQEEHLKTIKIIKDLKGSRYVELPGRVENGVQTVVKKEIDGLTQQEIQQYFGYMLKPEHHKQLEINGWAKWSQNDKSKAEAKQLFIETNNAKLQNLETNLKEYDSQKNNKSLSKEQREEAIRGYEQTEKSISQLKDIDYNKLTSNQIVYNLEKSSYLTGLSNMAGAEWSYKKEVDPIWKAGNDLEIQMQKLDFEERRLQIAEDDLAIKQRKEQRDLQEVEDKKSAQLTTYTKTADDLDKEINAGEDIKSIYNDFNSTNNEIKNTIHDIFKNYDESDKNLLISELNKRGIQYDEKIGNFKFFKEGYDKKYGLSSTILEAYEATGLSKIGGETATKLSELKAQRSMLVNDLKNVEEPALKITFEKNPDKYIDDFMDTVYQLEQTQKIDVLKDVVEPIMGKEYVSKNIREGYNPNYNLIAKDVKNELLKRPDLLSSFDKQTQQLHKMQDGNMFMTQNVKTYSLREDAKEETSKLIQQRTNQGLMTSIYTGFKIADEKERQRIIEMIPNDEVEGESFDQKGDMSFSFDKNKNLIVTQRKKGNRSFLEGKNLESVPNISKYIVNPDINSTLYNTLSSMVDLENKSNVITAQKGFSTPEKKVSLGTFSDNKTTYKNRALNIQTQFQQDAQKNGNLVSMFGSVNNAVALTEKGDTKNTIINLLTQGKKISLEDSKTIAEQVINKVNNYTSKVTSIFNPYNNSYTFGLEYKDKKTGKIYTEPLDVNKLTPNANYLLTEFPEMFITRGILEDVLKQPSVKDIEETLNNY